MFTFGKYTIFQLLSIKMDKFVPWYPFPSLTLLVFPTKGQNTLSVEQFSLGVKKDLLD